MKIIVGTRGSKLAVTQTNWVINKLKKNILKLNLKLRL